MTTQTRMAARGTQSVSLERRNCALMEKIKCLQAANANLKKLNEKLQEENDDPLKRYYSELLLRDAFQEGREARGTLRELGRQKAVFEIRPLKAQPRDNDKIKKKILKLKERHESLQDDIYTLEERLCSCTCPENRSNHEHKESKRAANTGRRLP